MTFQEFLSDRAGKILLEILILGAMSGFLLATGTTPDIIILLLIFSCLIRTTVFAIDFIKCRSRLEELQSIMDGLDQKYLFAECAPPPKTAFERRLFALIRRSCRSMTGAVSDAQAAGRSYREYVESWVHEVKSPITAARLICHSLDPVHARRLAPELAQIEAHVERALFYARAQNPERDCIIRECSLAQIVSETIDTYRTLLLQNNMCIETENLDHQVYTDSKWTGFILGQLLQNAARYTKAGTPSGAATDCGAPSQPHKAEPVSADKNDISVIIISAELSDRQELILKVSDNGIGIPAHELPRVFDRGFTGSNGRMKGGSTGMGLYLCRRLCGFLSINIQISSTEHEGTCVTLSFPAKAK